MKEVEIPQKPAESEIVREYRQHVDPATNHYRKDDAFGHDPKPFKRQEKDQAAL
ncbi:hypothetical protein KW798_01265 [Candidatus Parcubacteria bacterium]|nr:hypothetical protein [Candidatus Parcubacteria bacterium]